MHICQKYKKFSSFTHFCRVSKSAAIYALYPESFCMKNLAIRKVFAFSDSGVEEPWVYIQLEWNAEDVEISGLNFLRCAQLVAGILGEAEEI